MNAVRVTLVGNRPQCTRRTQFSNNDFCGPKSMPFKVFLGNRSKSWPNGFFGPPKGPIGPILGQRTGVHFLSIYTADFDLIHLLSMN